MEDSAPIALEEEHDLRRSRDHEPESDSVTIGAVVVGQHLAGALQLLTPVLKRKGGLVDVASVTSREQILEAVTLGMVEDASRDQLTEHPSRLTADGLHMVSVPVLAQHAATVGTATAEHAVKLLTLLLAQWLHGGFGPCLKTEGFGSTSGSGPMSGER